MKNHFFFLVAFVLLSTIISCSEDDDDYMDGIIFTDTPPVALSLNTNRVWVENVDLMESIEISNSCDTSFDDISQQWNYYNCGMFRTIKVRLYFGTVNNVRYISDQKITLVMDQETYRNGRELSEKLGTIKGYFGMQSNPLNLNNMRLFYFEQF